MKNKFLLSLFMACFLGSSILLAQINEEEHTRAFVYGLNFNTNGGTIGGLNLRFAQIVRPRWYRSFGLEAVAIKHPQEKATTSQLSSSRFIFAKRNYLYSIRPLYGFDYLIFRKAPEESVQITANFAVGPSFGIEVPYYIVIEKDVQVGNPPQTKKVQETKAYTNDRDDPWARIQSVSGLFDGLGQAKIIPALFLKAGVSLEFGEFRNNLTGIEVGFTSELFSRAPNILAPESNPATIGTPLKNKQYMFGAYFTIFLGSRK